MTAKSAPLMANVTLNNFLNFDYFRSDKMAEKHIRMTLIGPPGCGTIILNIRSNLS